MGRRQRQCHARSPRMASDHGVRNAGLLGELIHVRRERRVVVTPVRFVRVTVTSQVDCHHAVPGGQEPRCQRPVLGRDGQSMQQENRSARTLPLEVPHPDTHPCGEPLPRRDLAVDSLAPSLPCHPHSSIQSCAGGHWSCASPSPWRPSTRHHDDSLFGLPHRFVHESRIPLRDCRPPATEKQRRDSIRTDPGAHLPTRRRVGLTPISSTDLATMPYTLYQSVRMGRSWGKRPNRNRHLTRESRPCKSP